MITENLYNQATVAIEKAHSTDILQETFNQNTYPSELLYSRRMLAMLKVVYPENSFVLKLAVQCQHLMRWNIPRANFKYDRTGYHQWRREVMEFQLQQTTQILSEANIDDLDVQNIVSAIKNQGNKFDTNAQIILDTACLVFIKWYLQPFASKHDSSKVADILKKTTRKMSKNGFSQIKTIELSPPVMEILSLID